VVRSSSVSGGLALAVRQLEVSTVLDELVHNRQVTKACSVVQRRVTGRVLSVDVDLALFV
jgi:hypothetical protein